MRLLLLGLAAIASAYFGSLVVFQRALLFPRPPAPSGSLRPYDAQQVWLSTSSGSVEAWYLPPTRPPTLKSPLLIFFHGNGELIDFLPGEFGEPRLRGIGVLLVEFPGYGRSSGSPSQPSVTAAALAAFDWTTTHSEIDSARVVAYGRSLGGAAAAILAAERPTAALVLESTFTSVRSLAHTFGLPEFAVRDPFDTLALLPKYHNPILIVHGDHDEIVPRSHAYQLAHSAQHAQLHFLSCAHNDCSRPWSLIFRFLTSARIL